jgi:hypothetical protein
MANTTAITDISNINFELVVKPGNTSIGILTNLDKHVEIRFLKEKKTSRTYLIGLEDFIDEKQLDKVVKIIQTTLATGLTTKKVDGKKRFGFNGNHVNFMKKYLVEKLNIPLDKIQ